MNRVYGPRYVWPFSGTLSRDFPRRTIQICGCCIENLLRQQILFDRPRNSEVISVPLLPSKNRYLYPDYPPVRMSRKAVLIEKIALNAHPRISQFYRTGILFQVLPVACNHLSDTRKSSPCVKSSRPLLNRQTNHAIAVKQGAGHRTIQHPAPQKEGLG